MKNVDFRLFDRMTLIEKCAYRILIACSTVCTIPEFISKWKNTSPSRAIESTASIRIFGGGVRMFTFSCVHLVSDALFHSRTHVFAVPRGRSIDVVWVANIGKRQLYGHNVSVLIYSTHRTSHIYSLTHHSDALSASIDATQYIFKLNMNASS